MKVNKNVSENGRRIHPDMYNEEFIKVIWASASGDTNAFETFQKKYEGVKFKTKCLAYYNEMIEPVGKLILSGNDAKAFVITDRKEYENLIMKSHTYTEDLCICFFRNKELVFFNSKESFEDYMKIISQN